VLEELKEDMAKNLPGWVLESESSPVAIRGIISLVKDDAVIDAFEVRVELAANHPLEPPHVFEIGGRIDRVPDRHTNGDGSACLFVVDETAKYWNVKTKLSEFIAGPVTAYFLGQSYFELTGEWIFGQRPHEFLGVIDFYEERLGIKDDPFLLERMMATASTDNIKGHWLCPCRSGEILRRCHGPQINKLRTQVPMNRLKEISGALTQGKLNAIKSK
jgi:hypothetical protein